MCLLRVFEPHRCFHSRLMRNWKRNVRKYREMSKIREQLFLAFQVPDMWSHETDFKSVFILYTIFCYLTIATPNPDLQQNHTVLAHWLIPHYRLCVCVCVWVQPFQGVWSTLQSRADADHDRYLASNNILQVLGNVWGTAFPFSLYLVLSPTACITGWFLKRTRASC